MQVDLSGVLGSKLDVDVLLRNAKGCLVDFDADRSMPAALYVAHKHPAVATTYVQYNSALFVGFSEVERFVYCAPRGGQVGRNSARLIRGPRRCG